MRTMSFCVAGSIIAAGALATAPAQAVTQISDGTVSVVALFTPTVKLTTAANTFKASKGTTYEIVGTGGFSHVGVNTGKFNGTLDFSSTIGTTLAESLANFFVFNDGQGGTYNFSVDSVETLTYAVTKGVSSSISLYLLGTTLDSHLGLGATPTSLTLSFNSTGRSAYSASATLAVPPTGAVPEPATWAMAVMGFGLMGAAMRRRPRTSVAFA